MKKMLLTVHAMLCMILLANAQFTKIDDINSSANSGPFMMTEIPAKGIVVFWAYHAAYGIELWKSDGTPGNATLVKDIIPGTTGMLSQETYGMVSAYDRAYFIIDDKVHGKELWVTDGTESGTHIVTDYLSGTGSSYPTILYTDGSNVLVHANDGTNKGVYKTDGTVSGTYAFGGVSMTYMPSFVYKYKGYYYYNSYLGIFRSDGTANSQTAVSGVVTGVYGIGNAMLIGDTIYYGINNTNTNAQLKKACGDFTGATVISQWAQNGQNSGPPNRFYQNNEHVYFTLPCQYYANNSHEIAHLNTLTNNCSILDTILDTSLNPQFGWVATYKGEVYYRGMTRDSKRQLYVTDGTRAGTKIFNTALEGSIVICPVNYKDTLYFIDFEKKALWKTDGSVNETQMISGTNEVTIPFYDTDKKYFYNKNDTALIFSGFFKVGPTGINQAEIWKFIEATPPPTTGLHENSIDNQVTLFPNPVTQFFQISAQHKISKAEVYNSTGQLVLVSTETTMDVSGLSEGLYFVKTYSSQGVSELKFIKE